MSLAARVAEFLAAILCFYLATLYKNEEGWIDSGLQRLWNQLSGARRHVLSRHRSLVQSSAALVIVWLDRLYGPALLSARALSVSFLLALALNLSLLAVVMGVGSGAVVSASIAAALWGVIVRDVRRQGTRLAKAVALTIGIFLGAITVFLVIAAIQAAYADDIMIPFAGFTALMSSGFVGATVIDITAVAALRRLLRLLGTSSRWYTAAAMFGGSLLVLAFVFGVPYVFYRSFGHLQGDFITSIVDFIPSIMMIGSALSTAIPPALLLGLLVTLGIHRVLWPILLRSLNTVREERILLNHKKAFFIAGVYLLGAAVFPQHIGPRVLITVLLRKAGFEGFEVPANPP